MDQTVLVSFDGDMLNNEVNGSGFFITVTTKFWVDCYMEGGIGIDIEEIFVGIINNNK